MGILTLQQDRQFVITSDRNMSDAPVNRPPKGKPSSNYLVWTGAGWSPTQSDAITFATLDLADDYVKANYKQLSGT
jgi:hypothetical protein